MLRTWTGDGGGSGVCGLLFAATEEEYHGQADESETHKRTDDGTGDPGFAARLLLGFRDGNRGWGVGGGRCGGGGGA